MRQMDAVEFWSHRLPSHLLWHEGDCCRIAKAWFRGMEYSLHGEQHAGSGPGWIRRHWRWGPTRWPLYWCEAIKLQALDCGALAALSREAFLLRDRDVTAVQLIQYFPADAALHWGALWASAGLSDRWAFGSHAYHEAAGVLQGSELAVWDATDNCWLSPHNVSGYGSTALIRVAASPGGPSIGTHLRWAEHRIAVGEWYPLSSGNR